MKWFPSLFNLFKNSKPKIVVILGPTATGKSDLAVNLALKFNGEIVSADSRQVYRGLDLGSGKITQTEMLGIKHHLLDVVNPMDDFSVADFQKLADEAINKILAQGKLPIVVGGTGFYIEAITEGLILPEVKPNQKLRAELNNLSTDELMEKLTKLDTISAENVDQNNRPRIIRAIEIISTLGYRPEIKSQPKYQSLKIGLELEREQLAEKIAARLNKRLEQGMVQEVKNLNQNGVTWARLESLGLEYKFIAQFLQDKITQSQMRELIQKKSEQFAKRQMTWFQRDDEIKWFKPIDQKIIEDEVRSFL